MAASLILIFGFQHSETERGLPTLLFMAFPVQKDRMTKLPTAPFAPPRTYSYERHGYTVDDPWFWLKDPGYPKVEDKEILDYLKAENAYFETAMEPHKPLVRTLFEEMKGRIKEHDTSVPQKDGDILHWRAFESTEEHKSELQSQMTTTYALYCLKYK